MIIRTKTILWVQLAVIIVLASVVLLQANDEEPNSRGQKFELLSQRINLNSDEKSFLIVNFQPLKADIESYITKNNLNMSVYVENFRNGAFMGIKEREGFVPASLNKLPLAIIIMRKVESGALRMDTMLKISESDRDSSFGTLYLREESEIPLHEAMRYLLSESDNTAFNVLIHYVSSQDIEFTLDYFGLDLRIDFPEQAIKNHSNTLSPKSMSHLFSSLYFSTVLTPENSAYLISLMESSAFDVKTAAGLPEEVRVVHKFGERSTTDNTRVFHDCGIMYIDGSRIFYCIMSSGIGIEEATEHTGIIVNRIHEYVGFAKAQYEKYQKEST